MKNWNANSDCCDWNGVTCDHSTGDVIALDLSCGMLRGTIHPNSSLFHLPHLRTLNLAFNDFYGSKLPSEIGLLSNTLTHLNISTCGFTGQVPSEISLLHKLVSIDLYQNYDGLKLEAHIFINLLRNSTFLEELSLANVNISSVLPAYLNMSSSLRLLNLCFTRLQGQLPRYIFNLQFLEKLCLSGNSFKGHIPDEITLLSRLDSLNLYSINTGQLKLKPHIFISFLQNSTFLRCLWLPGVSIGLVLPTYLNISSSLKSLDLRSTDLKGKLPYNIFNLQYLEELYLSGNLTGPIPKVNSSTSTSLRSLDLSSCGLVGSLPKSLANLRNLTSLSLSYNKLNGSLPYWLFSFPSLEFILLNNNMFSGKIPSNLFSLRSLKSLSLEENLLSGQIDVLDQGPVLQTFRQLTNLTYLYLSNNNFRGDWELDTLLSSLRKLARLELSNSGLSIRTNDAKGYVNPWFNYLGLASCNIKVFPESLRHMKTLNYLDLSDNEIGGDIPDWAGDIGGSDHLLFLNLSNNFISRLPQFEWVGLQYMYLQLNMIQGPFPLSICKMNNLFELNMSNNKFAGVIPKCFGNITSSVINLRNNQLQGIIPNLYKDCGRLEGFILNGNQLEGEVPSFLSKCRNLKVVDLGFNQLNGTFPHWLGDLPNLRVLVLKSNNFHGPIVTSSSDELSFQSLQVLDLSNNGFVGQLPRKYFWNFKGMMNLVKKRTKPVYLGMGLNTYYTINVVVKGEEQHFTQLFIDYTIIDVSNNKFQGEIPSIIGNLNSLKTLNLSHNNLIGRIPHALGNLFEIESLDLSWNQLRGEIPINLAYIRGLAVLNLSQNNLIGRIPKGTQFNTFDGNSFGGNPGLCGFPLLKQCENSNSPQLKGEGYDDDDDDSGYSWEVVLMGYGCGTLIGLVLGYIMPSTGKPRWFIAISNTAEYMAFKRRRNKRRFIYIGK